MPTELVAGRVSVSSLGDFWGHAGAPCCNAVAHAIRIYLHMYQAMQPARLVQANLHSVRDKEFSDEEVCTVCTVQPESDRTGAMALATY